MAFGSAPGSSKTSNTNLSVFFRVYMSTLAHTCSDKGKFHQHTHTKMFKTYVFHYHQIRTANDLRESMISIFSDHLQCILRMSLTFPSCFFCIHGERVR